MGSVQQILFRDVQCQSMNATRSQCCVIYIYSTVLWHSSYAVYPAQFLCQPSTPISPCSPSIGHFATGRALRSVV